MRTRYLRGEIKKNRQTAYSAARWAAGEMLAGQEERKENFADRFASGQCFSDFAISRLSDRFLSLSEKCTDRAVVLGGSYDRKTVSNILVGDQCTRMGVIASTVRVCVSVTVPM